MIGDRLKKLRKLKGYTQRELSKLSGVSQQLICSMENGHVKNSNHVLPLAEALNVDYRYLTNPRLNVEESLVSSKPNSFDLITVLEVVDSSVDDSATVMGNKFREEGKVLDLSEPAVKDMFKQVLTASIQGKLGQGYLSSIVDSAYESGFKKQSQS